jgi:hypothetical protein
LQAIAIGHWYAANQAATLTVGSLPQYILFDGAFVYVTYGGGSVLWLYPNGASVGNRGINQRIAGMCSDGVNLWFTDSITNDVERWPTVTSGAPVGESMEAFIRDLRRYSEAELKVLFSFYLQRWLSDMGVIPPCGVFTDDFLDFEEGGRPCSPEAVAAHMARSENESYREIAGWTQPWKRIEAEMKPPDPDEEPYKGPDPDRDAKERNRAKDLDQSGRKFADAVAKASRALPELGDMWQDAFLRKLRQGLIEGANRKWTRE